MPTDPLGRAFRSITDSIRELSRRVRRLETLPFSGGGGGGITCGDCDLDSLADVSVGAPADQDVLTWDDGLSIWVAQAPTGGVANLDDIGDVNVPAPNDQDVLTWDSGSSLWIAQAAPGGAGTPASSVVSETAYGQAAAVGTGTDYARDDHTHGTPDHDDHANLSNVTANQHHAQVHNQADHTGTGVPAELTDAAAAAGAGTLPALVDHTHKKAVNVRKNSAGSVYTRPRINLIEGANITLTVADDAGSDEVDVTVQATSGSSVTGGIDLSEAWAFALIA